MTRGKEAGGDEPAEEDGARKAFLLRLPPDLMVELRGWASQELRSLNGHIEYLLRQAVRMRRDGSRRRDS